VPEADVKNMIGDSFCLTGPVVKERKKC